MRDFRHTTTQKQACSTQRHRMAMHALIQPRKEASSRTRNTLRAARETMRAKVALFDNLRIAMQCMNVRCALGTAQTHGEAVLMTAESVLLLQEK